MLIFRKEKIEFEGNSYTSYFKYDRLDTERYFKVNNNEDLKYFKDNYMNFKPSVSSRTINKKIKEAEKLLNLLGKKYFTSNREWSGCKKELAHIESLIIDKDNGNVFIGYKSLDVNSVIIYGTKIGKLNDTVMLLEEVSFSDDERDIYNKLIALKSSNTFKSILKIIKDIRNHLSKLDIQPDNHFLYNVNESINSYYNAINFALNNRDSLGKVITCDGLNRKDNTMSSVVFSNYFVVDEEDSRSMLSININKLRYYESGTKKSWYCYNDSPNIIDKVKRPSITILDDSDEAYKLFNEVYPILYKKYKLPDHITDELLISTLYETTDDIEFVDEIYLKSECYIKVKKPAHIKNKKQMKEYISSLKETLFSNESSIYRYNLKENYYSYYSSKKEKEEKESIEEEK